MKKDIDLLFKILVNLNKIISLLTLPYSFATQTLYLMKIKSKEKILIDNRIKKAFYFLFRIHILQLISNPKRCLLFLKKQSMHNISLQVLHRIWTLHPLQCKYSFKWAILFILGCFSSDTQKNLSQRLPSFGFFKKSNSPHSHLLNSFWRPKFDLPPIIYTYYT